MKKLFNKVLIANRGEIALRIIRACHELDIKAVAVFSEADREALHVRCADEAYCIGPPPSQESYLVIDRIIETAKKTKCQAIHPGYGFLAENGDFAQACEDAGIQFIGPSPEAMRAMGDKITARKKVSKANVPTIPGVNRGLGSFESMRETAESIGYPVLIKAALGGGGKGMRVCRDEAALNAGFDLCRKEALSAFGNPKLYLEKYLEKPRHIEFQIMADHYGNTIHLGERECSIQRRHQKLIEEAPSVALDENLRARMGEAAVAAAQSVGYRNAGTIEFLLDADKNFYFLEMNTRLQVEHPVTEMVTGIDLVHEQLRIAAGRKLSIKQHDILRNGHAIECRIYAEDPDSNFLPSVGMIDRLREPAGPGVRVDSGVYQGYEVPVFYDPLIAKLLTWAPNREFAIRRMQRALKEYSIAGVRTTIPYLYDVMEDARFQSGEFDTHFIEETPSTEKVRDVEEEKVAGIIGALIFHTEGAKRQKESAGDSTQTNPWKWAARQEGVQ